MIPQYIDYNTDDYTIMKKIAIERHICTFLYQNKNNFLVITIMSHAVEDEFHFFLFNCPQYNHLSATLNR